MWLSNPNLKLQRGDMCIANMVKPPLKPQRGDMWQPALGYLYQEEIDTQIAQMAADSEYQELHDQLAKEYEPAAWEALRLGEDSS